VAVGAGQARGASGAGETLVAVAASVAGATAAAGLALQAAATLTIEGDRGLQAAATNRAVDHTQTAGVLPDARLDDVVKGEPLWGADVAA
jgi:hypothetical protein